MLFPMMGLLFVAVLGGIAAGIVFILVKALRGWALFVALPPILGGLFSFALCWGLSLSLERLAHSERWAGLGFIVGYISGGLLGGGAGFIIALKLGMATRLGRRSSW
jgi:hypothetical protein